MPQSYKNQPSVNRFNFIRWYQDQNLLLNAEFAIGSGNNFTSWTKTIPTHTNLLFYSEQFDNAYWNKSGVTVTANAALSPKATMTADKIDFTAGVSAYIGNTLVTGLAANANIIYSIYLRADSNTQIRYVNGGTGTGNTINVTTTWQRFSLLLTTDALGQTAFQLDNYTGSFGQLAISLYAFGAQLQTGHLLKKYIPTTTAAVTADDGDISAATRINYNENSEDLSQASWTKSGVTVTTEYGYSHLNTLKSNRVQFNSGVNALVACNLVTGLEAYSYIIASIWIKSASNTTLRIADPFTGIGQTLSITTYWQRFSLLLMANASGQAFYQLDNYTGGLGQLARDIEVFGGQFEPGELVTDYIPTTSTAVTVNDGITNSRAIRINRGVTDGMAINQLTIFGAAGNFKVSFWAKKASVTNPVVTLKSDTSTFDSFEIDSISYQKYELELNALLADNQIRFFSDIADTSVVIDNISIEAIQLGESLGPPSPYQLNPGACGMPILTPNDVFTFYINFDTPLTGVTKTDVIPALYTANGERVYSWSTSVLFEITVGGGKHYYTNNIDLSVLDGLAEGIYYLALYNTATGRILYTSNYVWLQNNANAYANSSFVEFRHYKNIFNFQYEHADLASFTQKLRIMLLEKEVQTGGEVSTYREISTGTTRLTSSYDEKVVVAETYYFDRNMHEAADVLFRHETISINEKAYIAKGYYQSNLDQLNALSKGEIELIDQEFSEINK